MVSEGGNSGTEPALLDVELDIGPDAVQVLMACQENRTSFASAEVQHAEDKAGAFLVEVASGLVGEHDSGTLDQCPCKGASLAFARGHLGGEVRGAMCDTQIAHELVGSRAEVFPFGRAGRESGQ